VLGALAFAGPAQASLTGTTQSATNVLDHAATLRGQVDPSGSAPFYYFEYGPTTAYGSRTLSVAFASKLTVQATVSGLTSGTLYHFRVVAARDDRASRGADRTFTTTGSAPTGSDLGSAILDPLAGLPVVSPTADDTKSGSSNSGSGDSGSSGSDSSGSGSSGSGSSDSGGSDNSGSGTRGDDPDDDGKGDDDDSGDRGSGDSDGGKGSDDREPVQPVLGETVSAAPSRGSVAVREPGESKFVQLADGAPIPVGSTVDARRGTVNVVTALADKDAVQSATFRGAIFKIRQRAAGAGLTDIVLKGGNFARCAAPAVPGRARVVTAARRRPVRRLWGRDHHGRFRTHGRGALATVRGTTWVVADYCNGTRTRVIDGAVSVRDKHSHRTVLVRAGHSYFARTR